MKALNIIKTQDIDFLLAVGGGSVIDGTKFLSSAALYDGKDPWEILSNHIRTEVGMPFATVLTLPATGSEMNSGAVVTIEATHEKLTLGGSALFPQFQSMACVLQRVKGSRSRRRRLELLKKPFW